MIDDDLIEWERLNAKDRHLAFMKYCWLKGDKEPFIAGFHTRAICERIDKAFEDFANGVSTCLLISVHPRAGKTDIVSRYLGPHFLGEFPDKEVMQVSYQSGLASTFSAYGRNILRSDKYRELYPHIYLSSETNKKADWVIADHKDKPTGGKLYAAGLQSGLTGNGYHLGVLDDYFAGRAEAESLVQRDNAWHAFTDDLMTRAAPVSITIVVATQWHIDDINGRIKKEMESNPDFPQFEVMSFPAKAKDYRGPGKYPRDYLFEERYPSEWYRKKYAILGPYSSAALFDCNPTIREGGRFNVSLIDYYEKSPGVADKRWLRTWDLAHTARQRSGDDPDWTSGTKLSFEMLPGDPVPHLWVDNVFRVQDNAAERDAKIKALVNSDGAYIKQAVETSLDAKDAYQYLKSAMTEISWNGVSLAGKGDKGARATPLEAIFNCPGHVHVKRADWNNDWVTELMSFDGTGKAHDDQVDNLSLGYYLAVGGGSSAQMSEEKRAQMRARRHH
jgi:phage terminase large subunit-like protein